MEGAAEDDAERLRRRESTGRPLGDDAFAEKISRRVGRDLFPIEAGKTEMNKPRKAANKTISIVSPAFQDLQRCGS